jgi:peptidylprolyl isomerase
VLVRKVLALAGVVAVVLTLSACSTESTTASGVSDCSDVAQPGDATKAVTVTGGFNEKPTVAFATPLLADETQRVVLETGTGAVIENGQDVSINFSAYDGATGASLADTPYDGETYLTVSNKLSADPAAGGALPGIVKAVQCLPIGSRVLVVTSPADAFGEAGNSQLGVGPNSSLVIVADIVAALPTRATGVDQPAPDGFPAVVLDPTTGQPGVTMPSSAPPTETKIAVLKKGDGAVVGDNSDVTLQYSGFIWQTGEVFDSSWTRGTAATFNVNGVIQGFHDALVGQTVGSQVAVIIPPDQGYGANPPSGSSITADSTLFFVIDILSTKN